MVVFTEKFTSGNDLQVFDRLMHPFTDIAKWRRGCRGGMAGSNETIIAFHHVKKGSAGGYGTDIYSQKGISVNQRTRHKD